MKVDGNLCISCWTCVELHEKLFKFWEDSKAELIKQPETSEEIAEFNIAKNECPASAIVD